MANGTQDVSGTKGALSGAARTCVFFQAAFVIAQNGTDMSPGAVAAVSTEGAPTHRCMLNPGRSCGPDGEAITGPLCTVERQGVCQVQRRQAFARLVATLPTIAASGKQAIGI